jgi:hypothetical protein
VADDKPRHQLQEEKAAARAAAMKAGEARRKKDAQRLRIAISVVLKSEHGKILWAHLFRECGYNLSSLTRKLDGEVAPLSTECKEAQRLIYINLRKLAPRELLIAVEDAAESQDVTEEK